MANFDGARVELYLGKAKKEENKQAFDELFRHREEIEAALGASLCWNRGEDIKASKVFSRLDSVSIENEADWETMARFHAEWSRKLLDAVVPYLR